MRIIVSSSAGGAMDTITRVVTARLGDALGQPTVVDNRGGANGAIAAELAAKSQADGHTLMLGGNGNLSINPHINKKLGYDPLKDLVPVTSAAAGGHLMVVHPSLPVRTVKEFIALARARPGQLSYGTAGFSSSQHLAGVLLQRMTKLNFVQVSYKGGSPATAELVAGQTQFGFPSLSTAAAFVNHGRLRALAVTTRQRLKVFPQVPTLSEGGVPDFEAYTWYGFVVAAKTPLPAIARLNREIVQILNAPEAVELLGRLGMDVWTGTPEAFAAHIKAEYGKWGRITRESGTVE